MTAQYNLKWPLNFLQLINVLLFFAQESCINKCSSKYINGNNRVMATFMEVQTTRQKAMIEEAEQKERDRMAGKSVDDTPNLPGPASAANLLFNTPRGPEGAAAQPPPGASS